MSAGASGFCCLFPISLSIVLDTVDIRAHIPVECLRHDLGEILIGLPCKQIPTQEQGCEPHECSTISLTAGLLLRLFHCFSS